MLGRAMVAAGLCGVLGAHRLADLPASTTWVLISGALGLVWAGRAHLPTRLHGLMLCLLGGWAGLVFTVLAAQWRLAQVLIDDNVDKVSRVTLRVDSLPRLQLDQLAFEAVVLDAHPAGVPERIRVRWPAGGWHSP